MFERRGIHRLIRALWQLPGGRFGLLLTGSLLVLALLAHLLAPFDPLMLHPADRLLPPGGRYWLGTDEFGRDLLSRLLIGAQLSLGTGISSILVAALLGVNLGLFSGYLGGIADSLLMSLMNAILSFPAMLLAVVMLAVLGGSQFSALLAIAIVNIPAFARLTRAILLVEKQKGYVQAQRALGAGVVRILYREILPNLMAALLIQLTLGMAGAVLLESALSFLGLGAPPPAPSWGGMLSTGKSYLLQAPWYALVPGLALTLLVLALYLLSDSLRQVLDPKRGGLHD
jgi:peptide/nickel transport system permease protein